MKFRDLEKFLKNYGFYFEREGKHRIYSNGVVSIPIPYQNEINRFLAKQIMRQAQQGAQFVNEKIAA